MSHNANILTNVNMPPLSSPPLQKKVINSITCYTYASIYFFATFCGIQRCCLYRCGDLPIRTAIASIRYVLKEFCYHDFRNYYFYRIVGRNSKSPLLMHPLYDSSYQLRNSLGLRWISYAYYVGLLITCSLHLMMLQIRLTLQTVAIRKKCLL